MKYRTDNGSKLIEMIHNGTIQKDTLRYHDESYGYDINVKKEMYLILDEDSRDGSILARVIDSVLKCGFYRRFIGSIDNTKQEILYLIKEYEPATIFINMDAYNMDKIYKYLKSNALDKQIEIINYEEHWL